MGRPRVDSKSAQILNAEDISAEAWASALGHDLNRWVQRQFRAKELEAGTKSWGMALGDQSIVRKDKVIQTSDQNRSAYDGKAQDKHYIAMVKWGSPPPTRTAG